MKKKVFLLLLVTIPALAFLNVWSVFRYEDLKKSIITLESSQRGWLEQNKRMIAGIAVLSSPGRIEMLAKNKLDLEKLGEGNLIRIHITEGNRNP